MLTDTGTEDTAIEVSSCDPATRKPVDDARAAEMAVDTAQGNVTTTKTALDAAVKALDEDPGGDPQGTLAGNKAAAENAYEVAKILLTQAQEKLYTLKEDNPLVQAVLNESMAIDDIDEAMAAQEAASAAVTRTTSDLNELLFDADGNSVATASDGVGVMSLSQLQTAYDDADTTWNGLGDGVDKAEAAIALINAKHALDAAKETAAYTALKATLDAQTALEKAADTALEGVQTARTDAVETIIAHLDGTATAPDPIDVSEDDAAARVARVVAGFQEDHAAAVKKQEAAETDATEKSTALTNAQTAATNAGTRFTAAEVAYNAAAETIVDGESVDEELTVEYVEAYFGKQAADSALMAATTANTGAQKALTDAATAVTKALDAVNNPDAHDYLFLPDNPAGALTDALLAGDDTGGALVDAVNDLHGATQDNEGRLDDLLTPESMTPVLDADGDPMVDEAGNPVMTTVPESGRIVTLEGRVDGLEGEGGQSSVNTDAIAALTAEDDLTTEDDESGPVTANTTAIADHDMKLMAKKMYIDAIGEEMGFDPATGLGTGDEDMSRIDTNEAAIEVNSTAIDLLDGQVFAEEQDRIDGDMALGERIDTEVSDREMADTALGGRIDAEALAREAADIALDDRIDTEASAREMADTALGGRIDTEASAREMADTALGGRIDAEETARMAADTMLGGRIDTEEAARMSADVAEETARMAADSVEEAARMEADTMLHGMIGDESTARAAADDMVRGEFAAEDTAIRSELAAADSSIRSAFAAADTGLRGMINDNGARIGELSDDLDVVRAGVAASMALAGMPSINGRGISIGVGSFDGESAFAVGFQLQGEMASFKIGLTSGGGATGASAGVGFQF